MGKEPGTELAQYERQGGYNVLHPVVQVLDEGALSQDLHQSVSIVKIDPTAGDTYNDFRYANEQQGKYALSGLALDKIAAAAGIKWIPDLCKVEERTRSADGHVYIRFQAAGAVRQPNGEFHVVSAHKEIDTADVAEQLEDGYRRKLKAGRASFKAEDIPDLVRRDVLQIREHLLSLAESKARNRVIRKLLSLRQVYSKQDLVKPFVVPRLIYRPDLTDPREIERVQIDGARAIGALYGKRDEDSGEAPDAEAIGPSAPGASSEHAPGGAPVSAASVPTREEQVPSDAPSSEGVKPHPFVGEDETAPCDSCGWAFENPVHQGKKTTSGGGGGSSAGGGDTAPSNTAVSTSSPEPPRPKVDPIISEGIGPYGGRAFSEIVQTENGRSYLQAVAHEGKTKTQRDSAAAWLAWHKDLTHPRLGA